MPSVQMCRESRWMPYFSTKWDAVWSIYRDPFPHPALRDCVVPRLLSCVCWAMAITQLTHLRISIPSSGAPPGQVPAECFPGGAPLVRPASRRHVWPPDEVTMLGDAELPVCSPESPPLILSVVVVASAAASQFRCQRDNF